MEYNSSSATGLPGGIWEPTAQTSSTLTTTTPTPEFTLTEQARALVRQVRKHLEEGQLELAVDVVYDSVDELLLAGSFGEARAVLRAMIRSDLPLSILLSALTISLPWRKMLGFVRVELVEAVRRRAVEEGGEEKAAAVLHGLM